MKHSVLFCAECDADFPWKQERLSRIFWPIVYNVTIQADVSSGTFKGKTSIEVESRHENSTRTFWLILNAKDLKFGEENTLENMCKFSICSKLTLI